MKIIKFGEPTKMNTETIKRGIGCPTCGESKRSIEYGKDFLYKGIAKVAKPRQYTKGLFKKRYFEVDTYHCFTCGCIWEDEPRECYKI